MRDGNLVTSRGPQDLKKAPLPLPSRNGTISSPQRNEPPALVVNTMRFMPRPSLRTIALIALGFAFFAPQATKKCLGWSG